MTKKHFTWAADRIIQACIDDDISHEAIILCHLYFPYIDIFDEFGPTFNVDKFDEYIINEIKSQRYGTQ